MLTSRLGAVPSTPSPQIANMTATTLPAAPAPFPHLRRLLAELHSRQRTLTWFALAMLALAVAASLGWAIDDRTLRGANVWVKPLKFMLSTALLALTTAWFIGYLPPAERISRSVRAIVTLLVATATFEVGYITLQAALGQASHYNASSPLHGVMYVLMGIAAIVLTATQPMLAWKLHRHADRSLPEAFRLAVVLGLTMTFILGAGAAMPLGAMQSPAGPGIPFFGWSLAGGDLRPAHFFGIHAEQLIPLAAAALIAARVRSARAWTWGVALLYAAGCVALAAWAIATRV